MSPADPLTGLVLMAAGLEAEAAPSSGAGRGRQGADQGGHGEQPRPEKPKQQQSAPQTECKDSGPAPVTAGRGRRADDRASVEEEVAKRFGRAEQVLARRMKQKHEELRKKALSAVCKLKGAPGLRAMAQEALARDSPLPSPSDTSESEPPLTLPASIPPHCGRGGPEFVFSGHMAPGGFFGEEHGDASSRRKRRCRGASQAECGCDEEQDSDSSLDRHVPGLRAYVGKQVEIDGRSVFGFDNAGRAHAAMAAMRTARHYLTNQDHAPEHLSNPKMHFVALWECISQRSVFDLKQLIADHRVAQAHEALAAKRTRAGSAARRRPRLESSSDSLASDERVGRADSPGEAGDAAGPSKAWGCPACSYRGSSAGHLCRRCGLGWKCPLCLAVNPANGVPDVAGPCHMCGGPRPLNDGACPGGATSPSSSGSEDCVRAKWVAAAQAAVQGMSHEQGKKSAPAQPLTAGQAAWAAIRQELELVREDDIWDHPLGDCYERAVVCRTLFSWWISAGMKLSGQKRYMIMVWRKDIPDECDPDLATSSPENCIAEVTATHEPRVNTAHTVSSFVLDTPPQESKSATHATLRRMYDSIDHTQRIPVVVVDPAIRRTHYYTYVVLVSFPWLEQKKTPAPDPADVF
eukprot:TRINITY_DN18233_c0_g1_i1.p1 TRINITY_DN18233_c0_g1~~TRINITY_DN18233_c0_g1_i1.p1  ORF type:complete len:688 (+),score=84.24 TRINITY_DN18233_c0_g1_i1:163-2064(+)